MYLLQVLENLSADTIVQIISLFVVVATFIIAQAIEKSRDRQITRRDVYQKLELASIDLFRFEADHLELIRPVWEPGHTLPSKETSEYTATMNYVCQMLNLFELAISFRKNKTMPPDVFGSWVSWFYLLLSAPGFPEIWQDVKGNYLPMLRNIMEGGLKINTLERSPKEREDLFFDYLADLFRCPIIREWSGGPEHDAIDHFLRDKSSPLRKANSGPPEKIKIEWLTDPIFIPELVKIFIDHKGPHYISHSELQEGRAVDENHWAPDLREKLTAEFQEAIAHAPFEISNLVGAFKGEKLVGFMLLEHSTTPASPFTTLSDIVVAKSFTQKKVGEQLLTWLRDQLRERGIDRLYAESNIQNESAHHFLTKTGFHPVSQVFMSAS